MRAFKTFIAILLTVLFVGSAVSSFGADVDAYKYRGFKVYTPELPTLPVTPLYDIAFFLGGV